MTALAMRPFCIRTGVPNKIAMPWLSEMMRSTPLSHVRSRDASSQSGGIRIPLTASSGNTASLIPSARAWRIRRMMLRVLLSTSPCLTSI
jgi:hypothetical protein